MNKISLNIDLKGKRNYLQSADLYIAANNEIKKLYGEKFWISHLSFRKFLQKDCYLQESNSKSSNIAGIIRFTNNQELKELKIFEGKKIPQRSNDDLDSEIRKFCKIIKELKSAQTIIQKKISTIHSIVATTKFLHQEIVKKTGKWIFSQIDTKSDILDIKENLIIEIKNKSIVAEKFSESNIIFNNENIGKIRFMKI